MKKKHLDEFLRPSKIKIIPTFVFLVLCLLYSRLLAQLGDYEDYFLLISMLTLLSLILFYLLICLIAWLRNYNFRIFKRAFLISGIFLPISSIVSTDIYRRHPSLDTAATTGTWYVDIIYWGSLFIFPCALVYFLLSLLVYIWKKLKDKKQKIQG